MEERRACLREPFMARHRRIRPFLLFLLISGLAWMTQACGTTVRYQPSHTSEAVASVAAPPIVKTVDTVMASGSFLTWLDEGLRLTDAGHFEAALPYLEAAVASRKAYGVQKIILYWATAQVHGEVGSREREILYLERFMLSTSGYEDDPIFDDVDLSRWTRYARARLMALRVMRGGGYGRSVEEAIVLESVDEEVILVDQLRCGEQGEARLTAERAEIDVEQRRVIERLHLICDADSSPLTLYFDLTLHTPIPSEAP